MASSIGLNFFHIRTRLINRFKLAFQEIEQDIIGDYFQCNLPDELFKFNKEKATLSIKLFDRMVNMNFYLMFIKGRMRLIFN